VLIWKSGHPKTINTGDSTDHWPKEQRVVASQISATSRRVMQGITGNTTLRLQRAITKILAYSHCALFQQMQDLGR
jgi:hypothetical protein|tara:strand:+ start:808 stop:1035 length:228 start_codon:yes stop_codon:yes gene_type:complete